MVTEKFIVKVRRSFSPGNGVRFGCENGQYNSFKWHELSDLESAMSDGTNERWSLGNCG